MKREIWYACSDPVNRFWLRRWLREMQRGLTRDVSRATFYLADLDHLSLRMTTAELIGFLVVMPRTRVAVHGYNLEAEIRSWLRRLNVPIFRRLTRKVVRRLLGDPVEAAAGVVPSGGIP